MTAPAGCRSVDGEYDCGIVLAAVKRATVAIRRRDQMRSGTISESVRLVCGADGGTIAMRIEYLAAIAIVAAGAGLAVHSVGSLPPEKQSTPAAAQLTTLLAESVDPFLYRTGG
jgi:hypothetical protein